MLDNQLAHRLLFLDVGGRRASQPYPLQPGLMAARHEFQARHAGMAKRWRQRMPAVSATRNGTALNAFASPCCCAFHSNATKRPKETPMPARIIGMIGTQQEARRGSPHQGTDIAAMGDRLHRLHEQWNSRFLFSLMVRAPPPKVSAIALYAADHTERIKFPDRAPAGLGGAGAGGAAGRDLRPAHARADGAAYHRRHQRRGPGQRGRLPPKNDRYRRAGEYLDAMRKLWTSDSRDRPSAASSTASRAAIPTSSRHQQPCPPLFFGGSSEGALEMGARHC